MLHHVMTELVQQCIFLTYFIIISVTGGLGGTPTGYHQVRGRSAVPTELIYCLIPETFDFFITIMNFKTVITNAKNKMSDLKIKCVVFYLLTKNNLHDVR